MKWPVDEWTGCYDQSWRDLIVPEAFTHPAKMSRGLVVRIFDYLIAVGALSRDQMVLDPFGGILTTGIEAASRGVLCIGVELEPKFCTMAQANIELHRGHWEAMNQPIPLVLQGDSRKLRELVAPCITGVVSSPPFPQPYTGGGGINVKGYGPDGADKVGSRTYQSAGAEREPGNLEVLPIGQVDAVVSSPPYIGGGHHPDQTGAWNTNDRGQASTGTPTRETAGYGREPGQLGQLHEGQVDAVISSPPYAGSYSGAGGLNTEPPRRPGQETGRSPDSPSQATDQRYGDDPAQLARLPERPDSSGAETFWSAAHAILCQCYDVLVPGGWAVWVVKTFVRDRKIVDFPGDWRRLCEAVGFKTVKEVHAMLVQEERRPHLFDGERVVRRERKSFFRRLAETKGSPRVDWETVWFMRKP